MANPTVAKPSTNFAEILNTAATPGELMQCFVPFLASGGVRDVVGSVLGIPYDGAAGHGTGHPPQLVAGAFTFNSLSDPVYRLAPGSTAVRFPGRGWETTTAATLTASAHTLGICLKPFGNANAAGTRNVVLWGSGQDTLGTNIGYTISAAGVITLGLWKATTFESSTLTLTSGKTYLITCTIVSSTSRLWNVYCYDDQVYVSPSSTGTVLTAQGALSLISNNQDAVLNACSAFDGYINVPPLADIYMCFIHKGTFDPAINTYFATLVGDPCSAARGTYTATGTLAAGNIASWDATTSQVVVHSNRPTLGAAGDQNRYTYRLNRSTTPNFAPSVGTQITGYQASPELVDTTAVAGTTYYYVVEQTDGTTTVDSRTAGQGFQQVPGRLSRGDALVGVIGDSRSYGNYPAAFAQALCSWGYRVGIVNRGVSGSRVYDGGTVANSWQPNTTQDPVNGQASATLLANAMAEFAQGGVSYILSDLGVNDSGSSTTAAVFGTKYGYLLAQLTPLYTCCLGYPYLRQEQTLTTIALLVSYQATIAALANGTTIRLLDSTVFELGAQADVWRFGVDGLHFLWKQTHGMAVARSFARTILGDLPGRVFGG